VSGFGKEDSPPNQKSVAPSPRYPETPLFLKIQSLLPLHPGNTHNQKQPHFPPHASFHDSKSRIFQSLNPPKTSLGHPFPQSLQTPQPNEPAALSSSATPKSPFLLTLRPPLSTSPPPNKGLSLCILRARFPQPPLPPPFISGPPRKKSRKFPQFVVSITYYMRSTDISPSEIKTRSNPWKGSLFIEGTIHLHKSARKSPPTPSPRSRP